jgi:hypothetical protein
MTWSRRAPNFFLCPLQRLETVCGGAAKEKQRFRREGKNCNEKTTKQRFFGFGLLYDSENMLKLKSKTIKRGLMSMEYPNTKKTATIFYSAVRSENDSDTYRCRSQFFIYIHLSRFIIAKIKSGL